MRMRRSGARIRPPIPPSGRGRLGGLGRGRGGCCALLSLLLWLGFYRVYARLALCEAETVEQAQHTIGRLRALGEPGLGFLLVEHEAARVVLGLQRIERADPFYETAVTRHARVGHDNAIERALLCAAARQADF